MVLFYVTDASWQERKFINHHLFFCSVILSILSLNIWRGTFSNALFVYGGQFSVGWGCREV